MCGIVGALAIGDLPKEKEAVRQEVMRVLSTELMLVTEKRGTDATGAVILFKDGNYYGVKRGAKSSTFLSKFGTSKETYGSLLEVWKKTKSPVKAFVGHCRATTSGSAYNNMNNHPIKVGNIVGIHNGTLRNDDVIFKNLECKRDADVDSEAIFRLAAHYTNSGEEPFTMDVIKEIVHRLDGTFAVIMFNADNPYQIPVFRDGRPMEFVFIKDLSLLLIVSEKPFWDFVHCSYERMANYYDSKLPSLLGFDIEKGTLENDGAAIFDLTHTVDKDTKLKDIAEWEKLPSTGRIWKTSYTTTTTTTTNRAAGYTKPVTGAHTAATKPAVAATTTKSDITKSGDNVKRHVFDPITKKYTVKVGDTQLNDDESVDIPVTTTEEEKPKENTADNTNAAAKDEKDGTALQIIDLTEYDGESNASTGKEVAVIDNKEVRVVDMSQDPPSLIEAAAISYKELPTDVRGFPNAESLLDAAEIKDEETAKKLGALHLANRVFRFAWMKGFIAGCKYTAKLMDKDAKRVMDAENKTRKREQHIVGLKSLVILLAQFFNKTMSDTDANAVRQRLSTIAMEQKSITNVNEEIFHGWENDKLAGVKEIVKQAAQTAAADTKSEGEGNEGEAAASSVGEDGQ